MHCQCLTWCRVPEEENTYGGRYQMSEHHPHCSAYRAEPFTVIELDGTRCAMEPREADAFLASQDAEDYDYKVSTVMLTRDQFEKLPDFGGF